MFSITPSSPAKPVSMLCYVMHKKLEGVKKRGEFSLHRVCWTLVVLEPCCRPRPVNERNFCCCCCFAHARARTLKDKQFAHVHIDGAGMHRKVFLRFNSVYTCLPFWHFCFFPKNWRRLLRRLRVEPDICFCVLSEKSIRERRQIRSCVIIIIILELVETKPDLRTLTFLV